MAVTITVDQADVEHLYVDVTLAGMTTGTRYDVYRMKLLRTFDPDTGEPIYERYSDDRRNLWSSVAHRVAWPARAPSFPFRDYEAPYAAFSYFVVESAKVGPFEYDWTDGPYPLERGVLDDTVIDFDWDYTQLMEAESEDVHGGDLLVRSTAELGKYVMVCLQDIDVKYQARGAELAVMGRQYPIYVADTREARRGTFVVFTKSVQQYRDLENILFPSNGVIRPVEIDSGPGATLLMDDMRLIPLDVGIEQATPADSDLRFISVDFLEVDPTAPLVARIGDNDELVSAPRASFTISDASPHPNETVTFTDTSTGQFDHWEWTFERGGGGTWRRTTQGPHKMAWANQRRFNVKLRVYGPAGASTITRSIKVVRGG